MLSPKENAKSERKCKKFKKIPSQKLRYYKVKSKRGVKSKRVKSKRGNTHEVEGQVIHEARIRKNYKFT